MMTYLYFICDSEFKGDILLQCKQQFKAAGFKFFFAHKKDLPIEARDYLFGRVGVVVLPSISTDFITIQVQKILDFLVNFPLLKFMGLQMGGLFLTPSLWKDLCSTKGSFLEHSYYLLPLASFLNSIYSLQLSRVYCWSGIFRSLVYANCFSSIEWRPSISE